MKIIKVLMLISIALPMVCCDTIIDLENPLKGNITLTTDWSKHTEGISLPASYSVVIDNQTLNFTETTNRLPELEAGTYPVYVYNTPENITINGTSARVTTTANKVEALPGWLFTSVTEAVYSDFKQETIIAMMVQQIHQLNFELTITNGDPAALESVKASLSGIANGMDIRSNTYMGSGLEVTPVLIRDGDKLKGSVRLIGLADEDQILTLDITYITGKKQQIIDNISGKLVNFNRDKHNIVTLTTDMVITKEAEFESIIQPWQSKQGSGIAW